MPSSVTKCRTILVDAGSGPFISIWPGSTHELPALLEAEEAVPDLVIATHLDFDHAGGLVVDGPDGLVPAFPGAPVLVAAEAVADARRDPDGESPACRVIAGLDRAGVVEGYVDGDEPAPGLRLRVAPGHRAGHSIVEVGDSLVHVVDIVHHPLHIEHLEWDRTWDADPEVALATRTAILNELADLIDRSRQPHRHTRADRTRRRRAALGRYIPRALKAEIIRM